MKYGKRVCQSLKVVRKQIADANEIPYEITECPHQGNCPGTCPKCESELRYIENQLSLRRAAGKAISLVGLSLGISAAFTACGSNTDNSQSSEEVTTVEIETGEEIAMIPDTSYLRKNPDYVCPFADPQPEFPGGEVAMRQFIKDNQHFPAPAIKADIQDTRVVVSFIVEKDGSIDCIEVHDSSNNVLSKEAIRIVKSMPKWVPGKYEDLTVRVRYYIPITFKFE